MYCLDEHDLNIMKSALLDYYRNEENYLKPQIKTSSALRMFDRIADRKANTMDNLEKTNIILYLHRNLLKEKKLINCKGMYRTAIN